MKACFFSRLGVLTSDRKPENVKHRHGGFSRCRQSVVPVKEHLVRDTDLQEPAGFGAGTRPGAAVHHRRRRRKLADMPVERRAPGLRARRASKFAGAGAAHGGGVVQQVLFDHEERRRDAEDKTQVRHQGSG